MLVYVMIIIDLTIQVSWVSLKFYLTLCYILLITKLRVVYIKFGQKVIYNSRIHFIFFEHGNGLFEIQSMENAIILVNVEDLIYRLK